MIREILNPDLYHGHNKKQNFFEGWYFKISDFKKENTFAFIPGIFLGTENKNSHSFIQVVNGRDIKYNYLKYSTDEFEASKKSMNIRVNNSTFSMDGINLDINELGIKIKGKVSFNNIKKWKDTFINPGSMGFYNYLPFMQCYSQVCAMDIELSGTLNVNGREICMDNGSGYIEKNWGKDFPYSWIWVQGNQFEHQDASISCSIGHVPMPIGSFRGFLIGLLINDNFYSFTTINRSKIRINQVGEDVEIQVQNKRYMLNMKVFTQKRKFMTLLGPRDNNMVPIVNETLSGRVRVELIDIKQNNVIFNDVTECAGVEYGGERVYDNSVEMIRNKGKYGKVIVGYNGIK